MDLHKTNTRWLVHNWSIFGARTNHEQLKLTRFTTARTWGKPPPSPLYYTLCLFTRPTSKWHFVSGLPNGSFKIAKVGTLATLGPHNFVCKSSIEMRSKTSYSPCQDLSNGMSYAICMQGNRVDFRLLMVRSQTANLIPDLSFGHNLCFRCPNGSCEPISDI